LAERAYGPSVVFRIRHSDLIDTPEAALRSVFSFLGEPYTPECLEPLAQRINSSNVPADFRIDSRETDPSLVEQAMRLCREVEESSQPLEASPAAIQEIEAAFDKQVQFVATIASEYRRLAMEVDRKSTIIQHLRARRQRSNWRRSPLRALRESFRRGTRKDGRYPAGGNAESGAPGGE